MKNKILLFTFIFTLLFTISAFAEEQPTVEVKVDGKIETGEKIKVLINISDIKSFYAGAIDLKYNSEVLKVVSLEQGDLIKQKGIDKFEAVNKIDEQNGRVSYGFSCLKKINGFSGNGTFLIINAEVVKKADIYFNSKPFLKQFNNEMNIKMQLCNSDIKELEYRFIPYGAVVRNEGNNNALSNNNGSAGNNTVTQNGKGKVTIGDKTSINFLPNANSSEKSTSNSLVKNSSPYKKSNKAGREILILVIIIIFTGGIIYEKNKKRK